MSDLVIGIEVHVQLLSRTKMFCSCKNSYGDEPNTNICPVCLGLPGALPVVNEEATKMGVMLTLSLECKLNKQAPYYRKNYFYPDLPKGYQITQYAVPLGENGNLTIMVQNESKTIKIKRVHLEEDAGKMFHSGDITTSSSSMIDFNRCGAPLAEIVTEPCIETPEEAQFYLSTLRNLVRFINISTGNMDEGALRCDVNISVKNLNGSFGTKVEVKNLNSFRSARRALEFEAKRQRDILANGGTISSETRHFIESTGETAPMRSKEELNDYRYFPEPDLPTLTLSDDFISDIQCGMPETPSQMSVRFHKDYALSTYDTGVLTSDKALADFFQQTIKHGANPKKTCNWLTGDIFAYMLREGLELTSLKITPSTLAEFVNLVNDGIITNETAKEILPEVLQGMSPKKIIQEKNLAIVIDEGAILIIVKEVIEKNSTQVFQYKSGKTQLIGFFVGQIIKLSKGKIPAELVKKLLEIELSK